MIGPEANAPKQRRRQQQLRSRQAGKQQPQQQEVMRRRQQQAATQEPKKRAASQRQRRVTYQRPEQQQQKEQRQARPQGTDAPQQAPPATSQREPSRDEAERIYHRRLHAQAQRQLAAMWRGQAQAQIAAMRLAEARARSLASHGAQSLPGAQSRIAPAQSTYPTDSMAAAVAAAIAIAGPHNLRPVVPPACLPSALLASSSTSASTPVPAATAPSLDHPGMTANDQVTGSPAPSSSPFSSNAGAAVSGAPPVAVSLANGPPGSSESSGAPPHGYDDGRGWNSKAPRVERSGADEDREPKEDPDSVMQVLKRLLVLREKWDEPGARTTFLLAAVRKVVATAVTYPFQIAKARVQVSAAPEEKGKRKVNGNIFATVLRTARAEGGRALYDGTAGELLKGFFSHGTTMLSKNVVHRLIVQLYFAILGILRQNPHLGLRLRASGSYKLPRYGGGGGGEVRRGARYVQSVVGSGQNVPTSWLRAVKKAG
ncbi:hypothetical protein MYCTH_2126992 [Thermothelomyces thermophilus ATCC 42464]|uniref:Uncharacterized protein n=1 Tax=Thermothelomyces thermophilus (strain ATCC 42464 / BCRC 31852 / DSM 1799) TaxID=573729 RepID=G2QBM8_THET4|nr:uncharacterized protein MYCTH_2126992 [Thermothelomyces thermophilus ATCC 42464]AEO57971.1 hypothetical protein MYCTH_2126992 [Thermothelomyces thermophilus ATCC 42464]